MTIQPIQATVQQFASAQAGTPNPVAGAPSSKVAAIEANKTATEPATGEEGRNGTIQPDADTLRAAVERAQSAIAPKVRDITFSMDEKANAVVVKIVDRDSEEVIRQIPSEEFLRISEALNDQIEKLRTGLLVEQKA